MVDKRLTIFWLLLFILPFCWTYWPILEGARNSNFWYFGYFSLTGMRTMVETLFVHFPLQSLSGDYMFSLFASASIIQGDVRLWRDSQTWLNNYTCRLHVTLVAVQNRRSLHSAAKYERNTWFRCKSLVALFTQISDLGSWARWNFEPTHISWEQFARFRSPEQCVVMTQLSSALHPQDVSILLVPLLGYLNLYIYGS